MLMLCVSFFFFKQKTAYELRISDWSSDVCSSDLLEAVGRLVPGVMGNDTSADDESFSDGLLEYPHYTRPAEFRGWPVPDVLRSGDHARVERWRRAQSLARTRRLRPDLLEAGGGVARSGARRYGQEGDSMSR